MAKVRNNIARERERQAWEMRTQQGASVCTIAAALGVAHQAISLMPKRVGDRTAKDLAEATMVQKVEQSEIYDTLLEQAMQAWERSKKDG